MAPLRTGPGWGTGTCQWLLHYQLYLQCVVLVKTRHRLHPEGLTGARGRREETVLEHSAGPPAWGVESQSSEQYLPEVCSHAKWAPHSVHAVQPRGLLGGLQAVHPHHDALHPLPPLPGIGFLQVSSPVFPPVWFLLTPQLLAKCHQFPELGWMPFLCAPKASHSRLEYVALS